MEYAKVVGGEVKIDQVQRVTRDLADANVVMRTAHGLYCVTDAFVQEVWLENYGPGSGPAPALGGKAKEVALPGSPGIQGETPGAAS
jgi:hypothetical protein